MWLYFSWRRLVRVIAFLRFYVKKVGPERDRTRGTQHKYPDQNFLQIYAPHGLKHLFEQKNSIFSENKKKLARGGVEPAL